MVNLPRPTETEIEILKAVLSRKATPDEIAEFRIMPDQID